MANEKISQLPAGGSLQNTDLLVVARSGQNYKVTANYLTPSSLTREEVSGVKDGSNTVFTISDTPIANSLSLYLNGQLLLEGGSDDYTISESTITLTEAPSSGESVFAIYLT